MFLGTFDEFSLKMGGVGVGGSCAQMAKVHEFLWGVCLEAFKRI